jgi:hypothetical protein
MKKSKDPCPESRVQSPTSKVSPTDRACARYEAKLLAGHGTLARHGSIEAQMRNFRAAYVHGRELEARVRDVLVAAEVASIHYPFYFAFARRLDRLSRICSGESLRLEAQAYLDYWVARGLVQSVLKEVCADALSILV